MIRRAGAAALALVLCLLLCACRGGTEPVHDPDAFWDSDELLVPAPETDEAAELPAVTAFTLPYLVGQTLDPVTCLDGIQQTVGALLYEGLFALDDTFTPQPLLCGDHSVDKTGKVHTFRLRGDASFSDGSGVSANDVLATYRRAQASERYIARFTNIQSMRVQHGALVITLKTPDSALPALLDIPIVKSGSDRGSVPIGSGPYVFANDENGAFLLRRSDRAYGSEPPLERIELTAVKDEASAAYLFSAFNLHLLTADLMGSSPAAALSNADISDAPSTSLLYLGFNLGRDVCGNEALRRAMQSGFDRENVVASLLAGHAVPAQFPIHPASPLYPAALESAYDATSYTTAVTESGIDAAAPRELTLLVNSDNAFKVSLADYLCRELSVPGLTLTVRPLPWADYLWAVQKNDFDLYLGELRLTADWNLAPLLATGGALNYGGVRDAELDRLLAEFLAAESPETAAALCTRLSESAPIIPIVFKDISLLTTEGLIQGTAPTAADPFRGFADWTIQSPAS